MVSLLITSIAVVSAMIAILFGIIVIVLCMNNKFQDDYEDMY